MVEDYCKQSLCCVHLICAISLSPGTSNEEVLDCLNLLPVNVAYLKIKALLNFVVLPISAGRISVSSSVGQGACLRSCIWCATSTRIKLLTPDSSTTRRTSRGMVYMVGMINRLPEVSPQAPLSQDSSLAKRMVSMSFKFATYSFCLSWNTYQSHRTPINVHMAPCTQLFSLSTGVVAVHLYKNCPKEPSDSEFWHWMTLGMYTCTSSTNNYDLC